MVMIGWLAAYVDESCIATSAGYHRLGVALCFSTPRAPLNAAVCLEDMSTREAVRKRKRAGGGVGGGSAAEYRLPLGLSAWSAFLHETAVGKHVVNIRT